MAEIKRYTADFGGVQTPVIDITGDTPGPLLSVIAGVHGCEYASMAGLRRCCSGWLPADSSGPSDPSGR